MAITKPTPTPTGESGVLNQFSTSGGGFGDPAAGLVYMGTERYKVGGDPERGGPRYSTRQKWLTEEEAMTEFYNMPESGRRGLLNKFIVGGILPYGAGILEAEKEWTKLVQASARFGQAGQKVGPMDLLAGYISAAGGAAKNAWQPKGAFEVNIVTGQMRYAGPGTYLGGGRAQQTDTRTDLTDPDTAKAIATKLFQDLMGRDPGAGELGLFAKALHTAEANNPVTQTTTTTYNMETGQPLSQDMQSQGGVTAEGRQYIGEQQIKKKKEYGVNQAGTTYMSAFENLIYGAPE
jgi:hypothetical protein